MAPVGDITTYFIDNSPSYEISFENQGINVLLCMFTYYIMYKHIYEFVPCFRN